MKIAQLSHEGLMQLPVYNASSLTKGQGLIWGQDGSSTGSYNALVDMGDKAADIFAILQETPSSVGTNRGTPTINQAMVQLVKPFRIWEAYYDLSTSTDLAVSSSTSTVVTTAAHDDNLDGSWIYINAGTGVGQLRYIKAADGTTLTVNTAFNTTPDATSAFILIRHEGIPTGGIAFNAVRDKIVPILDETTSQKVIILKNFVESNVTGRRELDITANGVLEMDALNDRAVRFFSHIVFIDTIDAATGLA